MQRPLRRNRRPNPAIVAAALLLATPALAQARVQAQSADDLALQLQQSVAGVFDPGTPSARIMLLETAHSVQGARTLWLGDEYRNGWRLVSAGAGEATLRRGRQTLKVGLAAGWPAPPPEPVLTPLPSLPPQPLSMPPQRAMPSRPLPGFANAGTPAPADRQGAINRAIAAGQPGQVYQLSGSGRDVAQALARGLSRSQVVSAGELNTLLGDPATIFDVHFGPEGSSVVATRGGREVGRFVSPLFDLSRP